MPVSVAEAFGTPGDKAPPSPTPSPPSEDKAPIGAQKPTGVKISDVFAAQPKPTPIKDKVQRAAHVTGEYASATAAVTLAPFMTDLNKWSHEYAQALHDDVRQYPEGTGEQLKQSLKTAWDALSYVSGPIASPLNTGIINPVKQGIKKLGALLEKHAADDKMDMQARREGAPDVHLRESILNKGWEIHKRDVKEAAEGLSDATEALINAATAFVPGMEKIPGVRAAPKEFAGAKEAAGVRTSLKDAVSAIKPKEPVLTPISVSLDHTAGFGKISQTVGKQFQSIAPGSTRTIAALLDDMLPHAEGYAKSFLQKLNEHLDPNMQVRFKEVAGNDKKNLGVYKPDTHQIEIRTGHDDMVQTITHEAVHGGTINMLDTLIEADLKTETGRLGRALTAPEKLKVIHRPSSPILQELDHIIAEAKVRAKKAGRDGEFYGLKGTTVGKPAAELMAHDLAYNRMSPRYEFVAEVFSNAKFQEFLANSEKYASTGYRFKNMLNQLGLMLGKHFGMSKPGELQLLNQAMRVGSRLIEMQAKDKPPSNRGLAQIMYRDADGTTVTRGDMKRATTEVGRLVDEKAVRRARDSLKITLQQMLRSIAPETLGKNAKLAASVVASRITEQMQRTASYMHGAEVRQKFWRGRPDMVREFLRKFEAGESFSDPVLADLSRRYKEWNKAIFEQDSRISKLNYEERDNYLYHVFEDSEGVANHFTRKYGSKWGDPSFIKNRTFDLYQEAVAAGFRPRFDNPEDIMLARQHASDIAAMHTGILADLEKYGLATLKVKGSEAVKVGINAEGKPSIGIVKTKGNVQPADTSRWRAPNGDIYWVDNHANVIMENAFKSKSLWEDKGGLGMGFRGMMAMKNTIIPIRLALSLFHPLHVVGIDMAAGWTRTSAGLLSGTVSPLKFLPHLLRDGFGPLYSNVRDGWRVMKVWRGKVPEANLTPADTEALKYIVEGGMTPEMSSQYRTNARQNFMKAMTEAGADFRLGRPGGFAGDAARATWHAPWALLSAMQAPIFEHWIPSLKVASYLKDVKSILERNPDLAENDAARQLALHKIAKSVDNRYGEMAYNTLFWKRWVKDIAVLNTLSLGWNLGFIREYGGGALDLGQFAAGGGKLQRVKAGQLDRPLFVATYTTLGAATAGLMTWAMTGETPSSLLDYIAPRTGEKNPDGSEQRVNTMFYSREFAATYKHMQNEGVAEGLGKLVMNKGSGLFGMMHEWATGVNSYNQEIRNPESPRFQQVEQTLAYTLSDMEPISMKAMQEHATEQPFKSGVLSVLGFTPAPKYLTESKTIADIKSDFNKYVAPKQTPYDKAQYSQEYHKLRDAYQSGAPEFGEMLDKMSEQYELSGHDQRRIIKSLNSDIPPEVRMFMRLPWQQQKQILDRASPEERDLFLPHANKEHIRNSYEPPAQ